MPSATRLSACCRAGDHTVIAVETSRQLGLGTNVANAKGLPTLGSDGKVPDDLGQKYAQMILEADGFAEVRRTATAACWAAAALQQQPAGRLPTLRCALRTAELQSCSAARAGLSLHSRAPLTAPWTAPAPRTGVPRAQVLHR